MTDQVLNSTLRAIRRIIRANDQSGRKLLDAIGLTTSQLRVLQEIGQRGQATPGALAASLRFSQAAITYIADRLCAAGFVTRQRGELDKRQIILCITGTGQDALARTPDLFQQRFIQRYEMLPTWEQGMILAALELVGDLLEGGENGAARRGKPEHGAAEHGTAEHGAAEHGAAERELDALRDGVP